MAQNEPEYEEINIVIQIQNIGAIEIPALIRNQEVLIPVTDLFNYLKIKTSYSQSLDSVAGFFLTQQATYLVDRIGNKITYSGKTTNLKSGDLIRTETNLYLLSKYFGEIFGLDCKFNFRALAVTLSTKLELPAMREMRLTQMRQNVSRLQGETKVDTIIRGNRPLLRFGMADWSVVSTQDVGNRTDNRFNLNLGTIIAGGEANAYLNYNTSEPFNEKQQYYFWRFVNNDQHLLRQTTLGKISSDAMSSIYNPIVGLRLTNTPTTYRRSFGTYPLSDYTNPGWMVELYVNNVLVDYKKADASGFFNFEVPLVYGNSAIKLKFYGPWGEERSKEQQVIVPFNFLPPKEFEYTLSAGMVEDSMHSVFSRASLNYGLTRAITVGTGIEYLSSVSTGTTMPFVSLATRPFSNVLLSSEYLYGVRSKGILSYQIHNNIQFEVDYTKYVPGQKAINFNYLEERKAIVSLPIQAKNLSFYNRMTYNQIILPGTEYSTAEWLISGAVFGVGANLTNYAMFFKESNPYVYSSLSLSFRLPHGYQVMPQAQYEYSQHELISAKAGIEKYILKKGFFSLSYENNFKSRMQSVQLGLRYDLNFAQTGFSARQSNNQTTLVEMARGSLVWDPKTNYAGANNRTSVGRGGIVFAPFLDLNCNGKRDEGEPRAHGLNIRFSGGNSTENLRDTTVRVTDLEPYIKYYVELDANSFDNVSWKIKNKTLSVVVDPNSFKLIEIPVAVVGEVSGTVYKQKGKSKDGLGRITVNIFNENSQLTAKTLSEPDGYFSYLGLAPGSYLARIDTAQLGRLHLTSTPLKTPFTIKKSRDGDVIEGIDFTLKSTLPEVVDTTRKELPKQQEVAPVNEKPAQKAPAQASAMAVQDTATKRAIKLVQQAVQQTPAKPINVQVPQTTTVAATKTVQQNVAAQQPAADTKTVAGRQPAAGQKPAASKIMAADRPIPKTKIGVVTSRNLSTPQRPKGEITNTIPPLPSRKNMEDNILKKHYYVQVGAFIRPGNAAQLIKTISKMSQMPTGIVYRDPFYKVRFGPFLTQEELNNCLLFIARTGKQILQKGTLAVTYEEIGSIPTHLQLPMIYGFNVQVGSFKEKSDALLFLNKMSAKYPYPIQISEEKGIYVVKFGPFKERSDTKRCYKELINKGVDATLPNKF